MPTSLETITSRNNDDIFANITIDTEDAGLAARVTGPEGSFAVEIDAPAAGFDPLRALDLLDARLKAWADAIDDLRLQIVGGNAADFLTSTVPAPLD